MGFCKDLTKQEGKNGFLCVAEAGLVVSHPPLRGSAPRGPQPLLDCGVCCCASTYQDFTRKEKKKLYIFCSSQISECTKQELSLWIFVPNLQGKPSGLFVQHTKKHAFMGNSTIASI